MQQVIIKAYGGVEQLLVESRPDFAEAGPGQLLVDVEAAGVNYLDIYQRKGQYEVPLPMEPGLEGVGRIRAVGEGVNNAIALRVGQLIAWINAPGSYASQVIVPAEQAIAVPESFTTEQALFFQSLTAQYLTKEYRDIHLGDRILVHSAAGGVGQLLVQWFKHLGAWVVGITSSEAKASVAKAAGADAAIIYGPEYDFLDELMTLTNGHGVDLAFDGVGAATLKATLMALARGGTAVSIGSASGVAPAIEPSILVRKSIRLAGGSIFSYNADPVELQQRAKDVIKGIQEGWLRLGEGTAYKLSNVVEAQRDMEDRKTHGKVYLIP